MPYKHPAEVRRFVGRSLEYIEQGRCETVKIRYKTRDREIVIEIHGEWRITHEDEEEIEDK